MADLLSRAVAQTELRDGRAALQLPDAPDGQVADYLRQAEAAGLLSSVLEATDGSTRHYAGIRLLLDPEMIEVSVPTDGDPAMTSAIAGLPSVVVREVEYSLEELRAVHAQLTAAFADFRSAGVELHEIREDVGLNRVVVGIAPDSDLAVGADVLAALLGERAEMILVEHAPPVSVVPTVCQDRFTCPLGVTVTGTTIPGGLEPVELRGGVDLRVPGVNRCSSGFSSRRTSDNAVMMMTAGHCFPLSANVSHNVFGRVGVVTNRSWSPTDTMDGEVIEHRPINTYTWVRNNWVFTDANRALRITSVFNRSEGSQVVNAPIAKQGTTTNSTNGQVDAMGVTVFCGRVDEQGRGCNPDGFDITLINMTRARLCSRPGGSGGSVHWGSVAHGIVSLSNGGPDQPCRLSGDLTWFNIATDLETRLGVRIYES